MIPVKLTIEGLYSYQERQTIDFSSLTEAGLFAIFGNVGSGKSSILEAITFGLYGNSDRLNSKDTIGYNMMNLKSNKLYIEFEFLNHENKLFKITREYKRNSKNFDKITNSGVVLYESINDEWIPKESSDVEPILGLSSENFRRTIIIPQGKFQEFIQLKATERTHMMKEIFNLHRYDLQDKVAALNSKNLTQLNLLQGKLSGFEEISEENIKNTEDIFLQENEIASALQNEYKTVNDNFQRLKALKNDVENLKIKKEEFNHLTEQKIEIDKQQIQLQEYETVYQAFHQLLYDFSKTEKEIQVNQSNNESLKKELILLEHELSTLSEKINEIKPDFENLTEKRQEENDLQLIDECISLQKSIDDNKIRTENGLKKVEEVKLAEKEIENQIKQTENEIKEIQKNKINSSELMEVGNWFSQQQNNTKALANQQQKIDKLNEKIEQILSKIKVLVPDFTETNQFNTILNNLDEKKKQLEANKTKLEVQQELSHFAHNLHNGEACPLCGALEHPQIIEEKDVSVHLKTINYDLKSTNDLYNELKTIFSEKSFVDDQLKAESDEYKIIEKKLSNHLKTFVWQNFNPNNFADFEEKRNASLLLDKTIEEKNNSLSILRENLEKSKVNVERYSKKLEEIKIEEIQKQAQIKQNVSQLKTLRFEDYISKNSTEINKQLTALQLKNSNLEKSFKELTEKFNELNPKVFAHKKSIEISDQLIVTLNTELQKLRVKLKLVLEEQKIASLEDVKTILALELNVTNIRAEIQQFTIHFETLKNSIKELESKLENVSFDKQTFENEQLKLAELEQRYKFANEKVIELKTEIARLKKAFEEKKELLLELEKLQKRAENLKIMQNMFNKAGFVQYVSSIYLKQLCENANVRFHRMTRNQLSLQINETNDFEIIDYLNEGKSRSVKTLSGGQAFQVSLSLALALAESVQSNAQSDKSFFFIDEGFGTQDLDSVNIVFETLLSLQKENRIVGIISHVEELKDRIPMSLAITKDEEKGSLIEILN
ncbi:SMC family ATPase [Chishuiella sp.]|uniref:SMC family ATPase n=1 Tax=Chishuiella sp. TaxID=1969467 RepID=UPI0028A66929|nr:SMC family ATPase [Chishuiella sp.]